MNQPQHRISERDSINRLGVCSICGPVKLTGNGWCHKKHSAYHKERNNRLKPEKKAYMKKYQLDNKDYLREYKKSHWHLSQFGITAEEFAKLLSGQNDVCGICSATEAGAGKGWHLDHAHSYEKKDPRGHRGVLCHSCNVALGLFKDSILILQAAISYLARRKESAG